MTHATDDEQRPPLGTSRARVLAGLRAAAGDLGAVELAERVALHPNSVRYHLDALHRAGLVERRSRVTGHRDGRSSAAGQWPDRRRMDRSTALQSPRRSSVAGQVSGWLMGRPNVRLAASSRSTTRMELRTPPRASVPGVLPVLPGHCARGQGKPAHPLFAEPAWRTTLACPSVRACGPCADDRHAQVSWT